MDTPRLPLILRSFMAKCGLFTVIGAVLGLTDISQEHRIRQALAERKGRQRESKWERGTEKLMKRKKEIIN